MPKDAISKRAWGTFLAVALPVLLLVLGCGGTASKSTYLSHYHGAGWISTHPAAGVTATKDCQACHEMTVLRQGGPAPSCMTTDCHHRTEPGFVDPTVHGAWTKGALGPTGGSLASCLVCHGNDAKGAGTGVGCGSCHGVDAPHPVKHWMGEGGFTHTNTDPSNAPACAKCHLAGSPNNPPFHPLTVAPAGTAPGCFNNTLCHGAGGAAPHALGAPWLNPGAFFHGLTAKNNLSYCQSCHGEPGTPNFNGGFATTPCSTCHAAAKAHSFPWVDAPVTNFPGTYTPSHRNAQNLSTSCSLCHDYIKGRTAPVPAAPSCYSATFNGVACHVNGPAQPNHAVPFLAAGHTGTTPGSFAVDCSNCHALTGSSPVASAPLCTVCHQASSPLALQNCASCHSKPPVGSSFPDIAGTHATHEALTGVTGVCSTCHSGFDAGGQNHYDHANGRPGNNALRIPPGETVILAAYNGNGASASFNASLLTCANVSCHGGITSPNWRTGAFDANTNAGCLQCHTLGSAPGVPQDNSPYSGAHARHMTSVGALCTDCHSLSNGTTGAGRHFTALGTSAMEGPASDTIQYLGNRLVYDAVAKTCTLTCHGVDHSALSWFGTGGANHAVPYRDASHTGATTLTACQGCHALTGTSPMSSAPLCTVCHTAGSPLALTNCASCHQTPPAGAVFPAVAGAHGPHNALAGLTGACAQCHSGSDAGSLLHYNHANARPGMNALRVAPGETAFPGTTYKAKAGPMGFNTSGLTCSNISCHGAISAPNWQTGTIDSALHSGCVQCHTVGNAQGTPENNSPYTGAHALHMGVPVLCTDCHDMANGSTGASAHFTTLGTAALEGPASDTIEPDGVRANYTVSTQTCTVTCHVNNHVHVNTPWTGGASHSVPYPTHMSVTSGTFAASCASCHAMTGTSPNGSAPLCTVCHTAGSPYALTNCASCHVNPPTGASFPDVAGKHTKHNVFAGLVGACNVCHLNVGTGTTTHYDHGNNRPGSNALRVPPGQTAFQATYNARTGSAAFSTSAYTCANVSCHGGLAAPSWLTGTLSTNTDTGCRQCHTVGNSLGSPQWNSPYSGEHDRHATEEGFACTDCHNMVAGTSTGATNHFTSLNTTAMEGPASSTINFSQSTATGALTYNSANQQCTLSCHGKNHNPLSW